MDFTESYMATFPDAVRSRYRWLETRNAAQIMSATNPNEFSDLLEVLDTFTVDVDEDIVRPGGNESQAAGRLNGLFRILGWREGDYSVGVTSTLKLLPWSPAGERSPTVTESDSASTSYLIDNIKGRLAVDVEWHAKDGNLDRDLAAYRSLYDAGIIDAAVMITMAREEMHGWARSVLGESTTKFKSTTTTNLEKVAPRLSRGDGGGCPVLVVAVCSATI